MRFKVSAFLLLLLLHFTISFLLIADRQNDSCWLYCLEGVVALTLMLTVWLIISGKSWRDFFRIFYEKKLLEYAPGGYAAIDMNNRQVLVGSKQFEALLSPDVSVIEGWLQLLPPYDRSIMMNALERVHEENWQHHGLIESNQRFIRYHCLIHPGNITVLYIWLFDDSDYANKEKELMKLLDHYRIAAYDLFTLLNTLPIAIWQEDELGQVLYHNRKFSLLSAAMNQPLDSVPSNTADIYRNAIGDAQNSAILIKRCHADSRKSNVCYALDYTTEDEVLRKANLLQGIVDNLTQHNLIATLILDANLKILHFNISFLQLFSLQKVVIDEKISYKHIFEIMKENHRLPELKGFKEKHFSDITASYTVQHDLWHLASGTTIKVTIIPSSEGSTIITYQDITPNLQVLRALNRTKSMFSAVAQMIEYPMIIISQSGKISFMTDAFVEIFLLNKAVIPLHVSELFHESTMRMKGADIAAVLEMIVKALQAVTSTSYFFKICNAQYVSETRQLDDLSVVVTMQPMSWHHQRVKKVCSD